MRRVLLGFKRHMVPIPWALFTRLVRREAGKTKGLGRPGRRPPACAPFRGQESAGPCQADATGVYCRTSRAEQHAGRPDPGRAGAPPHFSFPARGPGGCLGLPCYRRADSSPAGLLERGETLGRLRNGRGCDSLRAGETARRASFFRHRIRVRLLQGAYSIHHGSRPEFHPRRSRQRPDLLRAHGRLHQTQSAEHRRRFLT